MVNSIPNLNLRGIPVSNALDLINGFVKDPEIREYGKRILKQAKNQEGEVPFEKVLPLVQEVAKKMPPITKEQVDQYLTEAPIKTEVKEAITEVAQSKFKGKAQVMEAAEIIPVAEEVLTKLPPMKESELCEVIQQANLPQEMKEKVETVVKKVVTLTGAKDEKGNIAFEKVAPVAKQLLKNIDSERSEKATISSRYIFGFHSSKQMASIVEKVDGEAFGKCRPILEEQLGPNWLGRVTLLKNLLRVVGYIPIIGTIVAVAKVIFINKAINKLDEIEKKISLAKFPEVRKILDLEKKRAYVEAASLGLLLLAPDVYAEIASRIR